MPLAGASFEEGNDYPREIGLSILVGSEIWLELVCLDSLDRRDIFVVAATCPGVHIEDCYCPNNLPTLDLEANDASVVASHPSKLDADHYFLYPKDSDSAAVSVDWAIE